jgi:hypothetical protein
MELTNAEPVTLPGRVAQLSRAVYCGTTIGPAYHIPKFSFRNVNHFSHKKLKIFKKNSFILN